MLCYRYCESERKRELYDMKMVTFHYVDDYHIAKAVNIVDEV